MSQNTMTEALLARPTLAIGQFLRRAIAWWLAELAGMAPRPIARLVDRSARDTTILDLTGGQAFLLLEQRGRPPLSVVLEPAPDEARRRVGALLRRHDASGAVTIRVDPGRLFVTTLDLPRAAEGSLQAVVRHQVERMVPLPAAHTCFACRALPRPASAATLKVAVAVAKREPIDQALALARAVGLSPRRLVAAIAEAGPTPLVLWQADRPPADAATRRWRRALESAALALALVAYGLHIHRLDQVREGMQNAVSQARQQAAATRELGQRVAQSADTLAFLRARRLEPKPLQVLDDLTRLLPLDVWASDLTLRGRNVEIAGTATHAADLIGLIDGSSAFARPQFHSPITLLPDGHTERFDLTFDVKPDRP